MKRSKKESIHWGISGNSQRIFISTSWGCAFHCKYCYLRQLGIKGIQQTFTKEELLENEILDSIYVEGKGGSIITIGCYTECLDDINHDTTMEIIEYFLQKGNYIQISTKKQMQEEDFKFISQHMQYKGQMNLFVSIPTITYAGQFEPDADPPQARIKNFCLAKKYGINSYLYIKPQIDAITIKDVDKYIQLIKKYNIATVVGEYLFPVEEGKGTEILIGKAYMQENISCDSAKIIDILGQYSKVYMHSDCAINELKKE